METIRKVRSKEETSKSTPPRMMAMVIRIGSTF